jgi:hypothetical protein
VKTDYFAGFRCPHLITVYFGPEKDGVGGSTPFLATIFSIT